MKLLVINGPNLNLLGLREPGIYGKGTLSDLEDFLRKVGEEEGVELSFFQSNHEGAIVDTIQAAYGVMDGIVINPAAYTHTSVALPHLHRHPGCPEGRVPPGGGGPHLPGE